MELGGVNVFKADGGAEGTAVVTRGGDHGRVFRRAVVAVDEVDLRALRQPFHQRGGVGEGELVPAHVGDLEGWVAIEVEAGDAARDQAETGVLAHLVARLEEELHAKTDAQEWLS